MNRFRSVSFNHAVALIKNGDVVAIPTETVYGLAGSVFNTQALRKIFRIKKRPSHNPLIVHCSHAQQMNTLHTVQAPLLQKLIQQFCPGPLTLILKKDKSISSIVTAGKTKVGLRIPRHDLTIKLIQTTNVPLCAPSANISGQLSPTCAEHVYDMFKGQVPVLDGGACQIGIESTVLEPDFDNRRLIILRPGMLSREQLVKWLNKENLSSWTITHAASSLSPGQSSAHYQPRVPLILIATRSHFRPSLQDIQNRLAPQFSDKIFKELLLTDPISLCSQQLYHQMNMLSQNAQHIIYVIRTHQQSTDAWLAIWNRLEKAASLQITW